MALDEDVREAIKKVDHASRALGITSFLVGGLAPSLLTQGRDDLPAVRGTADADFAVRVSSWDQYRRLHELLLGSAFTEDSRTEHRLHHRRSKVDLLPYGQGIVSRPGRIRWPKAGHEFVVVGFEQASAHTREIDLGDGVTVRCATVPAFVLLKIVAFLDRKERHERKYEDDARDIYYWMDYYASGPEDHRRFEELPEDASFDFEGAGAAVLGKDVRAVAGSDPEGYVSRFLGEACDPEGAFRYANSTVGEQALLDKVRAFGVGFRGSAR